VIVTTTRCRYTRSQPLDDDLASVQSHASRKDGQDRQCSPCSRCGSHACPYRDSARYVSGTVIADAPDGARRYPQGMGSASQTHCYLA
jgi:hypothetical protein